MALDVLGLRLPQSGETAEPMEGIKAWRNKGNGFLIIEVRYTAMPRKRGDYKYRESAKYGGIKSWKWQKEMEINWEAQAGKLVFENWEDRVHCIRPFAIPAHWPRWVLIDPGWTNPMSILWAAVDVDTPANDFGFHPVHIYREFYKAKYTATFAATLTSDWSKTAVDLRTGDPTWEWIEAIVLDPMAKQEHQSAQDGENVNEAAETFLTKFTAGIEAQGWTVPIDTGNNLKDAAIEEIITRLGCFWTLNDLPLFAEDGTLREPTLEELADGAEKVDPTLFVHLGCDDTAKEMRGYRFRDWASGDVRERHNEQERPVDKDDHSVTNIIRFINLLQRGRAENGADLSAFTPRHRPHAWEPSEEQQLQDQFRGIVSNYRKRLGGE